MSNEAKSPNTAVIHGQVLQLDTNEYRYEESILNREVERDGYSAGAIQKRNLKYDKLNGKCVTKVAQLVDMMEETNTLLIQTQLRNQQRAIDARHRQNVVDHQQEILALQRRMRETRDRLSNLRRGGHRARSPSPERQPASPAPGSDDGASNVLGDMHMGNEEKSELDEIKAVFDEEHKECVICHEELSRESISIMHCGHVFHFLCAQRWWRYGNGSNRRHSCATCRVVDDDRSPYSNEATIGIIGEVLLTRVFGAVPEPPPLSSRR